MTRVPPARSRSIQAAGVPSPAIDGDLLLDHDLYLRLEEFLREPARAAALCAPQASQLRQLFGRRFGERGALHELAGEILVLGQTVLRRRVCRPVRQAASHRGRHQRVHTEGLVREAPDLRDPLTQLVGATVRSAEYAEPTRLRDGGGQRGQAGPSHSGECDRDLDPE